MSAAPAPITSLPDVRGKYDFNTPLASYTWFKVGGVADVIFSPEDRDDLVHFLKNIPDDMPVMALGVGSNLLIRDGGLDGAVIRLGKKFSHTSLEGMEITAGTGTPDITVASACRDADIAGLEFLRGVPGTIGGALRMNAGAYGAEIADVMVNAEAVDRAGNIHYLSPEDMGFSYRHTKVPQDFIFTAATLKGHPGKRADIEVRMKEIADAREESQPLRTRTGGSTFKNPAPKNQEGEKAWALIDRAGCRGLRVGGAMVSEKHCNFLINEGTATAADIENLGEEVRRRVKAETGVTLEWEIKILGKAA